MLPYMGFAPRKKTPQNGPCILFLTAQKLSVSNYCKHDSKMPTYSAVVGIQLSRNYVVFEVSSFPIRTISEQNPDERLLP